MNAGQTATGTRPVSLRLWPGVVMVLLLLLVRFGFPIIAPDLSMYAVIGGVLGGVLVLLWWLFFSRAPWGERLGILLLIVVAMAATRPLLHPSIRGGMMGLMFVIGSIPFLSLAPAAPACASSSASAPIPTSSSKPPAVCNPSASSCARPVCSNRPSGAGPSRLSAPQPAAGTPPSLPHSARQASRPPPPGDSMSCPQWP